MKYLLLLGAVLAHGKVMDSGAGGFTIQHIVQIKAAPEEVYRKLVGMSATGGTGAYFFAGCAQLENRGPAGRVFLREDAEQRVCAPSGSDPGDAGQRLVLSGALGPLQNLAATGSMLIQFKPEGGALSWK